MRSVVLIVLKTDDKDDVLDSVSIIFFFRQYNYLAIG